MTKEKKVLSYSYKNEVKRELKKFCKYFGNQSQAAEALGISSALMSSWIRRTTVPSREIALAMERLTFGFVNANVFLPILLEFEKNETLSAYMSRNFLKYKAQELGISVQDFMNNFCSPTIKKIYETESFSEKDIKYLVAQVGGSVREWSMILDIIK